MGRRATMHGKAAAALTALMAMAVACALAITLGAGHAQAQQGDLTAAIGAKASVMGATAASMSAQAAEPAPDYSWYSPSATSFTLATDTDASGNAIAGRTVVNKLIGLRNIVNGLGGAAYMDDFDGKTITLAEDANLILVDEWIPIGTPDNPFEGSLDGAGHTVSNMVITHTYANAGLFGVTGYSSAFSNIKMNAGNYGGVFIGTAEEPYAGGLVQNVGALVGDCGGTLANCSAAVPIVIYNDTPTSAELGVVVDAVGGLAGRCAGSVSGCSTANTGTGDYAGTGVTIRSASEFFDDGSDQYYLIMTCIGGVVGFFGDLVDPAGTTAAMTDCSNAAEVKVTAQDPSGVDRFGVDLVPQAGYMGGIAGYATGSIENCTNSGAIDTSFRLKKSIPTNDGKGGTTDVSAAGSSLGGIVGGLRSDVLWNMEPTVPGAFDAGTGGQDNWAVVSKCANTGSVFGHHAVGGIVGSGGWYSLVTASYCAIPQVNIIKGDDDYEYFRKVGGVKAARWNKPMAGGIAGKTYGSISYCYNTSRVWSTSDAGYYVAGIAGVLFTGSSIAGYAAPVPEMWGCYNVGFAQSSLRAGSLAGQNEGYIHDCYALTDTSYHGANAEEQLVASQYAAISRCGFVDTEEEMASAETVGKLNAMAASEGWAMYFVTASDDSVNDGFPVLSWQDNGPKISLADPDARVSVSLADDADYTGAPAEPSLKVTYTKAGVTTELVQNADFKVVVADNAIDRTLDSDRTTGTRPYRATIQGMGRYEDAPYASVNYGIVVGDLSDCEFMVLEHKYTGAPIALDPSDISIVGAAGNVVDPSCYTLELNDGKDCVARGTYKLKASVAAGAGSNYQGVLEDPDGFAISPADLYQDCVVTGVSAGDTTYATDQLGELSFAYTGQRIVPAIDSITYTPAGGQTLTLVAGSSASDIHGDYYAEYLSTDETGADDDYTNVRFDEDGEPVLRNIHVEACRPGTTGNYHNYLDLYFKITPKDLSDADVSITVPDQAYTGEPRGAVLVEYNGMTLVEGRDFEVAYENNVEKGSTATATISGVGNYAGTVERTFKVLDVVPTDIDTCAVADIAAQSWTGEPVRPAVSVTGPDGETPLVQGVDFMVSYESNVDAGTGVAVVVGSGRYSGTVRKEFSIVSHQVSFATTFGKLPSNRFTTNSIDGEGVRINAATTVKPTFQRGLGAAVCVQVTRSTAFNTDCNLESITVVGDATGTVYDVAVSTRADSSTSGINWLQATFAVPDEDVTITQLNYTKATNDLASCTVDAIPVQSYTGEPIIPDVVVRNGSTVLRQGIDYEAYVYPSATGLTDNVNVSTNPIALTLVGKGAWSGSLETSFRIGEAGFTLTDASFVYDGLQHGGATAAYEVPGSQITYGTQEGVYDSDECPTFRDAGTHVVYIQAKYSSSTSSPAAAPHEGGWFVANGAARSAGDGDAPASNLAAQEDAYSYAYARVLVVIEQAPLTIAANPVMRPFDSDDPELSATVSGLVEGDQEPAVGVDYTLELSPSVTRLSNPGVYSGAVRVGLKTKALPNYRIVRQNADLTISPLVSTWTRVAGSTRYATMQKIVQTAFPEAGSSAYAIVVSGADDNFPDALSASALAGAYDCPILTTSPTKLSAQASSELKRLGVTNVFVVGGEKAVSPGVVDSIRGLRNGMQVTRISGSTRYATSTAILNEFLQAPSIDRVGTVFLATGAEFPDALAAGPLSYAQGAPILLVNGKWSVNSAGMKSMISALKACNPSNIVILGGEKALPKTLETALEQAGFNTGRITRIAGSSRYQTSTLLAQWAFARGASPSNVCVATGLGSADALAGATLCGRNNSVLVLTKPNGLPAVTSTLLKGQKGKVRTGYVFGGEKAVAAVTFAAISATTK